MGLTEVSDLFTVAATLSYVVALLAFATAGAMARVDTTRSTDRDPVAVQPVTVAAGVASGSAAGSSRPVPPADPDPADPPAERLPSTRRSTAERASRAALTVLVLAAGLHALGLLTRGITAGRPPLGTMYEFATACAFAATASYLILVRQRPDTRGLGLYLVTPVAAVMGLAVVVLYDGPGQLVPALQSGWLAIHVSAAVLSVGVLTVGAVASALFMHATRAGSRRSIGGLSAHQLDTIARTAHMLAFPIWTFAVIAGAIWAEAAWGRFWGWDPKETCAFITWVLYAAYLHARTTAGWSNRRFAVIAIAAYASMIFNFVAINVWFSGLHSYAGL